MTFWGVNVDKFKNFIYNESVDRHIIVLQRTVVLLPLTNMRNISGWVESLPLTDTRNINGRVHSLVFSRECFFAIEGAKVTENGFYIISDQFFEDFPDKYLKGNKTESRPHYYAFRDKRTGLFWVIPMSSRVDKYKQIISRREAMHKPCHILHIAKLDNGEESVFLIQDMFPITEKYVLREYTLGANHFKVTSETLAKIINKKAKNVLNLLKRNVKFSPTQPDVLKIERELLK